MSYTSFMFIAIILTAIVAFIHKLLVLVQRTYARSLMRPHIRSTDYGV